MLHSQQETSRIPFGIATDFSVYSIMAMHLKIPSFLLISLFLTSSSWGQSKLVIVLRVDDILSRNTAIQPRSIVAFEAAAEQRGAKVTWVTIPHRLIESSNADGALTRELRASVLKGHEVAQHGHNHICLKCGSSGHEFFCMTQGVPFTLNEQLAMIDDGLGILADSIGVHPTAFVSPGHNEDTTTYRALVERGFPFISTTKVSTKQMVRPGLFNLAHHNEYTWALTATNYGAAVSNALASVRAQGEADGYFAFLFHDYFTRSGYEGGIVIRWLGEVLDSLKARYGERLEFLTLSEAAARFEGGATVVEETRAVPTRAELLGNFPNPFNPMTVVSIQLSVVSRVDLRIFDLLGREVAVLASGEKSAGEHRVTWDARGMASGMYVCELRAGGVVQRMKMMLMR